MFLFGFDVEKYSTAILFSEVTTAASLTEHLLHQGVQPLQPCHAGRLCLQAVPGTGFAYSNQFTRARCFIRFCL